VTVRWARSCSASSCLCLSLVCAATSVSCDAVFGLDGLYAADAGLDGRADSAVHRDGSVEAASPPNGAVVIASSNDSTNWCAVTVSGEVECWGENEIGELGDGTTRPSNTPVKVKGLPGPSATVTIGLGTVCAVTTSGAAYCWGLGYDGELGNGTTQTSSLVPVPVAELADGVTAISSGDQSTCAVRTGAVWCWGNAQSVLLGTGQTTDALVPVRVPGLESGVTSVSVGGASACAVKNGAVLCWGAFDENGELGNGSLNGSATPVPVEKLTSGVASVSVGLNFACALTDEGGVLCWGDGTTGALGNGEFAVSPVPVQVVGLETGVSVVSAGAGSVSAIKTDGSVVTWGFAADGELGNGSAESDSSTAAGGGGASTVPVKVKGLLAPAVSVSTGQAPCVALRTGGVECWGITAENALSPVRVSALGQVTSLAIGGSLSTGQFACAVSGTFDEGLIWCWGGNNAGQLGTGTTTDSTVPVQTAGFTSGVTQVTGGVNADFACAVISGLAYCWGDNGSGQLGNGTRTQSSEPVAVETLSGVVAVSAGYNSTCAITTSGADAGVGGSLYCWGDNTYGQLGNGTTTSSAIPVAVAGLSSGVMAVAVGLDFACAVLADGTASCWGTNSNGQLGNGSIMTSLLPTPVTGIVGATAVGAGWFSACVVASEAVKCWGYNDAGQLGDGTFTSSMVPVNVKTQYGFNLDGVSQVSVSVTAACAVVSGGAQCWGVGPLGVDSPPGVSAISPDPVIGLGSGVTSVSVGVGSACAVAHGETYCWGLNSDGELGNGGSVDAFLPTPVAGFP
jgi:alpha-tubulin suppressor-like RCC1 family protein